MAKISEIKSLDDLSNKLYKECKMERHSLFQEEYDLEITSLGEMEVFIHFIEGVVFSITKEVQSTEHLTYLKKEHLDTLKKVTLEEGIPNLAMIKKYPLIFKYVKIWEKLRLLSIEYLEDFTILY
ncbi:MAG: hypothetical protein GY795_36510 [Desulfobacterales bacterium]|nr:hypothetical protein [Desulfobacterales bacterium]